MQAVAILVPVARRKPRDRNGRVAPINDGDFSVCAFNARIVLSITRREILARRLDAEISVQAAGLRAPVRRFHALAKQRMHPYPRLGTCSRSSAAGQLRSVAAVANPTACMHWVKRLEQCRLAWTRAKGAPCDMDSVSLRLARGDRARRGASATKNPSVTSRRPVRAAHFMHVAVQFNPPPTSVTAGPTVRAATPKDALVSTRRVQSPRSAQSGYNVEITFSVRSSCR